MKKVLGIAIIFLTVLVGCGNDDEVNGEKELTVDETAEKEAPDITSDPMEIAMNDFEYFSGSSDDYKVTRYTSDDLNSDGLIELEVAGYEIKFTVIAGESEYGDEDKVFVVGEQENTNDDGGDMQMNRYEIKTSEGEKLDDGWNYSSVDPGIRDKVSNEFELEYDIPDEIELHVDSVYEEVEGEDFGEQHEVDKTFTFTKE